MKIIKKFDSYLENIDNKDIQMDDNELKDIEDTKNTDSSKIVDSTEEEDEYIGMKMLEDLSKILGVPFNGNSIEYKGKKINFFSETEMFHIDKKKFSTIDEVIKYLESQNIKVNEDFDGFDDEFDDDFDDDFDMDEIEAHNYDLDAERNDDLDEEEINKNFRGFNLKDNRIKWPQEEEAMESRITKRFRDFK